MLSESSSSTIRSNWAASISPAVTLVGRNGRASKQADQQHRQAAEQEQNQVFQPNAAAVLLVGVEQKLHRRPIDDLELPLVEQVNQDRQRNRRRPGDEQPGIDQPGGERFELGERGMLANR